MFCIEKQIYYLRIVSFKLASGDHRRLVKGGSNVEYASVYIQYIFTYVIYSDNVGLVLMLLL